MRNRITDFFKNIIKQNIEPFKMTFKWLVFAILSGVVIGIIGTLFFYAMDLVTHIRIKNPWIIFFLPLGGVVIVFLYRVFKDEHNKGTNLVLSAIHSNEELPIYMAPLIVLSTLITHLFGGSAGREGAALQLGGSIGNNLGKIFRFSDNDKNIMIMCGMSAAFSALFGTPMAAAIFSMEVVSIGIMHYSALLPCVISSFTAYGVAKYCGVSEDLFHIFNLPEFNLNSAMKIALLAILSAIVSIIFCTILHKAEHIYKKYIENTYIRIIVGGSIIVVLTLIVGNQTYNGAGMSIIAKCIEGDVKWEMFLLKILFTAITLGAGYKGGEIVPSFFIGATFGCLFGNIIGFSPSICAAVGMTAVFCGVTNCPITSLLISFEMFGYEGMPFFLLAIAFSYVLSGYYGLYKGQRIIYSKYRTNYINTKAQ